MSIATNTLALFRDRCHLVCTSGSAAEALHERNRRLGLHNRIVEVFDDLRIGSLQDADQAMPRMRLAWAARLWRVSDNLTRQRHACELVQFQMQCQQWLLAALKDKRPLVVWVGNNAHDQLMLAMVAHLAAPHKAMAVVDVTRQVGQQHMGQYSPGMCRAQDLLELAPTELTPPDRQALADEWRHWKHHGHGWRACDADSQICEHPLDHFDALLLAHLDRDEPKPLQAVLGSVMGQAPGLVPDVFLLWRVNQLHRRGDVQLHHATSVTGLTRIEVSLPGCRRPSGSWDRDGS